MNLKIILLISLSFLSQLFFSCGQSSSGENSVDENGAPFLKPLRDNPIVERHNAEYEKIKSQLKESLENRNRFLTENELPPSVRKSYLEGWDRVIKRNLDNFIAMDHLSEKQLVGRFRALENMIENVNKKKVRFSPTKAQKDQYNSLQETLKPYRNQLDGWLVNNRNSEDARTINLEIVIFELRKIASKSVEQFLSTSMVQEQYFTKYLDKKGEDALMLIMNGTLKK